jgi:NADPH2:quinone reductase
MKAVRCNAFGAPESLVVEDIASPVPGAGEVLIDVKAAGVNFPDSLIIQNKYQIKPPLPFTPGGELAGVVRGVGPGVTQAKVGQSVIAFTLWGAFAEQALVPQDKLIPMPEGMPYDIAGSFLMTYGTCYHALHDRAQVKAGETVLVLGAGGGIGIAAIELAKAMGARVIAAASSDDKLAVCRSQGADETINYTTQDLRAQIKELTDGRGVDVVIDPVGGKFSEAALRSIAWRGRFLVIGFADGEIPKIPLNLVLLKGCAIVGVFWGDFVQREPAHCAADLAALVALYQSGAIKPLVSGRHSLEQAGAAITALTQRKVSGKLIVVP